MSKATVSTLWTASAVGAAADLEQAFAAVRVRIEELVGSFVGGRPTVATPAFPAPSATAPLPARSQSMVSPARIETAGTDSDTAELRAAVEELRGHVRELRSELADLSGEVARS